MNLYEFLLVVIAFLIAVGVYLVERKERRELLNRIMAKDLKEYSYYDKKFKKDIIEEKKIEDEARKEREDFRKDIKKEGISPTDFEDIEEEEVEEEI
jgi:hypothetical protein